MDSISRDHLSNLDLQADNEVKQQLFDASKWTKFISISAFVACAFLVLVAIMGGEVLAEMAGRMMPNEMFRGVKVGFFLGILVFLIAVITFVYYLLFNFSSKVKRALLSENTDLLNGGLRSLKIFFIISGVFSILTLLNSLYKLFLTNS